MLKRRAFSAAAWSGGDLLLRQSLQFAVAVILARLLTPEEFGTVALLYLFTGIAGVFVDSGFSSALIQRQDTTHVDESTVFWFNLSIGAVAAIVLWMLAPYIADFYGISLLVLVTRALGFNVFLSALGSIHVTVLNKRLDFRKQMMIGAVAASTSGSLAVAMAWAGFGVWALVAQTLVMTATTTLLLWIRCDWRPGLTFSIASARKLFGFGGYMFASSLLEVTYSRLYTLLVGKGSGVRALAYYNCAETTRQLPGTFLSSVFSRVAFALFASRAHDKATLRRGVQFSVRGLMLLNIPMMLGMAALAEPIIIALYGDRWLAAVPTLQVLCLAGLMWPLHVVNLNALMAQGHSHLYFRLEVAKKVAGVVLLAVGATQGVMGVAWSQVVFGMFAFAVNAHYTRKQLDYGALAQIRDCLPATLVALPMALGAWWWAEAWQIHPLVKIGVIPAAGAAAYFLMAWQMRIASFRDMLTLVHQRPGPLSHAADN